MEKQNPIRSDGVFLCLKSGQLHDYEMLGAGFAAAEGFSHLFSLIFTDFGNVGIFIIRIFKL